MLPACNLGADAAMPGMLMACCLLLSFSPLPAPLAPLQHLAPPFYAVCVLPCISAEPVQKQAGAPVYGGTVNVGGPLRIRASRSAPSCHTSAKPQQAGSSRLTVANGAASRCIQIGVALQQDCRSCRRMPSHQLPPLACLAAPFLPCAGWAPTPPSPRSCAWWKTRSSGKRPRRQLY